MSTHTHTYLQNNEYTQIDKHWDKAVFYSIRQKLEEVPAVDQISGFCERERVTAEVLLLFILDNGSLCNLEVAECSFVALVSLQALVCSDAKLTEGKSEQMHVHTSLRTPTHLNCA